MAAKVGYRQSLIWFTMYQCLLLDPDILAIDTRVCQRCAPDASGDDRRAWASRTPRGDLQAGCRRLLLSQSSLQYRLVGLAEGIVAEGIVAQTEPGAAVRSPSPDS